MLPAALLALLAGMSSTPGHSPRVRPVECNLLPGERGANVWERAKIPELRRYCDLVASASAKLVPGSRMVPEVVHLSDEADALVPGRAAPMILKGRALSRLGKYADALVAFRAAETRDEHALDDPAALLAWARSLDFTGDAAHAHDAYRLLLPRADALPLADRGVAYLGAGMLAMSRGPSGLEDSIAILRQARRDSQDLLRSASTFALALALDRAGDAGESTAVLAEEGTGEAASVMHDARVIDAMGKTGSSEAHAIEALALDAVGDHSDARDAWLTYLSAGPGVWEAHARAHAPGGMALRAHHVAAPALPAPRHP
jgi:tetratricopeptide (TPR) repeat protein